MAATIVVGGQYGSEGKGKVVALTAARLDHPWVVRCGGPNSGHTTSVNGEEVILRQVPAAAGHPNAMLLLSAGCAVDEDILIDEVMRLGLPKERVVVDARAVLITSEDKAAEASLAHEIGSTASGTGAALIRRMQRTAGTRLVVHSEKLRDHVCIETVAMLLHDHLDHEGDVIVEGTQGFGLSLLHGAGFPHVTARDTTAAAFAMEVGLAPHDVTEVIVVLRTFPIRVAGKSGRLDGEMTWEAIQQISGAPEPRPEFTSVTQRIRRVGCFNMEAVKAACRYNRPTALALMGLDRLDHGNHRASQREAISAKAARFISTLHRETRVPIRWAGTGFGTFDAIEVHADAVFEHSDA